MWSGWAAGGAIQLGRGISISTIFEEHEGSRASASALGCIKMLVFNARCDERDQRELGDLEKNVTTFSVIG